MSDRGRQRATALNAAVAAMPAEHADDRETHERRRHQILRDADEFYAWLAAPAPVARLIGHVGPPTPIAEGNPMSNPQIPAGYSVTITIEPEDIDGNAVTDTLTWTSSDPTDVTVTADTTTLIGTVAVLNPAVDVTVTATDGTNTYTYELDGVADAPVNLVATVSAPFKTPAAPSA
jgi:hypothetical protein